MADGSRRTPAQERSLARLRHSRGVWDKTPKGGAHAASSRDLIGKKGKRGQVKPTRTLGAEELWANAVEGRFEGLERAVREGAFNLTAHNDRRFGATMMHYAAWHAQADVIKMCIDYMREEHGDEGVSSIVNAIDTVYSRATPLLLASRTSHGELAKRLECVDILVAAGAEISAADSHGDTCLHIFARDANLPAIRLVTSLIREDVVFAVMANNHMKKRPLDLARAATGGTFAVKESLRLLQQLVDGGAFRYKIACMRKRAADLDAAVASRAKSDVKGVCERASSAVSNAQAEVARQYRIAEGQRAKEETAVVQRATEAAEAEGKEYLATPEGRTELVREQQRQHDLAMEKVRQTGGRVPRNLKRTSLELGKREIVQRFVEEAVGKVRAEFRDKNPRIRLPSSMERPSPKGKRR